MSKKSRTRLKNKLKVFSGKNEGWKKYATIANKEIQNTLLQISWDNIIFCNEFIKIKVNNVIYKAYYKDSQENFNIFKQSFKLINTPKIEIKVNHNEVKVLNEPVLFFHFKFFKQTGTHFTYINNYHSPTFTWKQYTKEYYKEHLSYLFVTKSLKKLFELSNARESIIPIAEASINRNGNLVYTEAFLFRVSSFVVWESTEPSRATYVFNIKSNPEVEIQVLYDYISGDTISKRETLMNSKDLRLKLNFKDRIIHNLYNNWLQNLQLALHS